MKRIAAAGLAVSLALSPTLSDLALAQPGPPGPPPYSGGPDQPPGYQPGYAYGDPDVPPPEGYGGPNQGYDAGPNAQAEDQHYAHAVQQWSAENCIDQRNQNTAAGAVIGGVLGALLGSGLAGRGNRGAGAFAGGAVGAVAGASIGANSTSPGCPPGYVVRPGAPPFAGPVFVGGYVYDAPPGYRPWMWVGGRWTYRPYPYHRYWYRYERRRHWRD